MPESLEFHAAEPGTCRIASLHNVLIVSWTSRATGTAVTRLAEATQRMIARYPSGISGVHMIADKTGLPTPEGRSGLMRIMNEQSKSVACLAVVLGGTGFWASMIRSFITSLLFMSPRHFELRLHGSATEVLEWLPREHEKNTGVSIDAAALARVLSTVEKWPSEESDLLARPGGVGR